MDASNEPVSNSVIISLLPTHSEWSQIDLPHLTLVYAGKKSDHKSSIFNELAKEAAMLASLSRPIGLRVMGREIFGPPNDQVDVFRLQPSIELLAMRRSVEKWNKSEYSFKPHVTIGPIGTIVEVIPRYIRFNRIFVGWGNESLVFGLNYD